MKRLLALVAVLSLPLALPASAAEDEPYPEYTGPEFVALYDYAVENLLPGLEYQDTRYSITGDEALDARIWEVAFSRGYVLRPLASRKMATARGVPMQPPVAPAWLGLEAEARAAGMRFIVSSAYRSPAAQRAQFLSKLEGTSDAAINAALNWWSIPGTSKHHGGYALDFRYADGTFAEFSHTPDYAWLAASNFAIPKRYGLIPSYPDGVGSQGPRPEPWEFVWVGTDLIRCGLPQDLGLSVDGPVAALVAEIERCPGGAGPAAVPEWLMG
ncbi:MAG TPA: hypothetical protein EYP73_08340 [Acidimicrobiia bacterium]|nr:hypothetical protein [Acidimicrobiia bacterium]